MTSCLVLFRSIHDVMRADRALEAARVARDMVPVPKEVSTECGMCIEVEETDIDEVRAVLHEHGAQWTDMYRSKSGSLERM